MQYLLTETALI